MMPEEDKSKASSMQMHGIHQNLYTLLIVVL